jgi:hypothetical protein
MPKYRVVVEITETYEVEADSAEEACEMEIQGDAGDPCVEVNERYAVNESDPEDTGEGR